MLLRGILLGMGELLDGSFALAAFLLGMGELLDGSFALAARSDCRHASVVAAIIDIVIDSKSRKRTSNRDGCGNCAALPAL